MSNHFAEKLAAGKCPICSESELVYAINRDARRCANRFCGFVVSGKELRMFRGDPQALLALLEEKVEKLRAEKLISKETRHGGPRTLEN